LNPAFNENRLINLSNDLKERMDERTLEEFISKLDSTTHITNSRISFKENN
jgi:hypothetical protein